MSSKACFMDGDIQFGVPIVGGTGEIYLKHLKILWICIIVMTLII